MKHISFSNINQSFFNYDPEPTFKTTPEWYKNLNSYVNNIKKPLNSNNSSTVKKCMPMFDIISSGYTLFTPCDVWVSQRPLNPDSNIFVPYYEWPSNYYPVIDFHTKEQLPNYPDDPGHEFYPKWINMWSIKTPKDYSVLILPPIHRSSIFKILSAIVDTDKYNAPINFPFMLNNINFEGLIPAKTPIAQIIPFKRDDWKMILNDKNQIKNSDEQLKLLQSKFFEVYKNFFRQKKSYN